MEGDTATTPNLDQSGSRANRRIVAFALGVDALRKTRAARRAPLQVLENVASFVLEMAKRGYTVRSFLDQLDFSTWLPVRGDWRAGSACAESRVLVRGETKVSKMACDEGRRRLQKSSLQHTAGSPSFGQQVAASRTQCSVLVSNDPGRMGPQVRSDDGDLSLRDEADLTAAALPVVPAARSRGRSRTSGSSDL